MEWGSRGFNIGGGEEETKAGWLQLPPPQPDATSHLAGYLGDFKYPGRCDCFGTNYLQIADKLPEPFVCDQGGGTPLDSDLDQFRELERRRTAQQAELGGLEELWREGFHFFINVKIVDQSISTFSGLKGLIARSFGL